MKENLPVVLLNEYFNLLAKTYRTTGSKARDSQLAGKQVD